MHESENGTALHTSVYEFRHCLGSGATVTLLSQSVQHDYADTDATRCYRF